VSIRILLAEQAAAERAVTAATADEARATLAKLPLVEADLLNFDYFPDGPFAPLASLIGRE